MLNANIVSAIKRISDKMRGESGVEAPAASSCPNFLFLEVQFAICSWTVQHRGLTTSARARQTLYRRRGDSHSKRINQGETFETVSINSHNKEWGFS